MSGAAGRHGSRPHAPSIYILVPYRLLYDTGRILFLFTVFLPYFYIGVVEPPVLLSIDMPPLYILVSECAVLMPSLYIYVGAILPPVSTPIR